MLQKIHYNLIWQKLVFHIVNLHLIVRTYFNEISWCFWFIKIISLGIHKFKIWCYNIQINRTMDLKWFYNHFWWIFFIVWNLFSSLVNHCIDKLYTIIYISIYNMQTKVCYWINFRAISDWIKTHAEEEFVKTAKKLNKVGIISVVILNITIIVCCILAMVCIIWK
jgi:hypothetical protein